MLRKLTFLVFLLGTIEAVKLKRTVHNHSKTVISRDDFIGCPLNNDFYYNGTINSPLYPYNYPPNDKCYYYISAEPGTVLKISFSHFDLESCCDFITIYDGPTDISPKLVQIGGPGSNVTKAGTYYTTTRNAVVTFESNPTIQKSGFSMQYESVNSVSPCNRDVYLVVNGLASVGTQDNFQKQINFLANQLTPTWNVGLDKVRVMMNLQVDMDYAVVWSADDLPTNADVTQEVLHMVEYVPDVTQNNNTDLECLFRYAYDALDAPEKEFDERYGIEQVVIVFVASNPNTDQDFNEAFEFSHKMRTSQNAKVIVVGMGPGLDQSRLARLAYAQGYAFFSASYDNLSDLIPKINNAICSGLNAQCGP
uniref:CUB domain-containing protein n=1 Tax=Caenorhabditis japonica TaxID=281687 RepID=A0A8R1DXS9_CAEJA